MKQESNVLARIEEHYQKMSKNHRKIAEYILHNYDEAVFMTAAKLGETLGISESTVVRFASGIGYEGYPGFQKALEECVRGKLSSVQKMNVKYGRSSQSEILTSVLGSDMEKIQYCMQATGMSKTDILRKGVDLVYTEITNKK